MCSSDLAVRRVLNVPRRGIGNATLEKLEDYARMRGIGLYVLPWVPSENCQLCPPSVPCSFFRYSARSAGVLSPA